MSSVESRAPQRLKVKIVSANPETLDGLQIYLRQAGIDARGTRQILSNGSGERSSCAIVLFPDDFRTDDVLQEIAHLRKAARQVVILVTSEPQRFANTLNPDECSTQTIIVVPKPVWGWVILDAIRDRCKPT